MTITMTMTMMIMTMLVGIDDVDDDNENDENDDDGDFYLQKHRCRNIDRFRPYWLDVFSVYSVYRK